MMICEAVPLLLFDCIQPKLVAVHCRRMPGVDDVIYLHPQVTLRVG